MAGGLAMACLAAVAVGAFAALGATAGSQGWAMPGAIPGAPVEPGMAGAMAHEATDAELAAMEAEFAAMEAEIEALEAERDAFLAGIGVTLPALTAEEAAEVRERAATVLEGYAVAYADGATPEAGARDALNAEYDAILAEFGAAPQALTAEQARAIAEYRDAEGERLDAIYDSREVPGMPDLSEEDAAELARIDEEADAIAERFGLGMPDMTEEEELALAARLAPLEQRYDEVYAEIDALYEELERLDEQNMAIAAASGAPSGAQLTDEQWAEFEAAMLPLEERAERVYERIYSALPQ